MQKQDDENPQFDPGRPDPGAIAVFLLVVLVIVFALIKLGCVWEQHILHR